MNMIPLLIVGYMLFILFVYAIMKAASDYDDEMERQIEELYDEMGKQIEEFRKLNNLDE